MFTFCLLDFLDCLRTSKTCLVYAIPIKATSEGLSFLIVMYSICTKFLDASYGLLTNHFHPKICYLTFSRKDCTWMAQHITKIHKWSLEFKELSLREERPVVLKILGSMGTGREIWNVFFQFNLSECSKNVVYQIYK